MHPVSIKYNFRLIMNMHLSINDLPNNKFKFGLLYAQEIVKKALDPSTCEKVEYCKGLQPPNPSLARNVSKLFFQL